MELDKTEHFQICCKQSSENILFICSTYLNAAAHRQRKKQHSHTAGHHSMQTKTQTANSEHTQNPKIDQMHFIN